ncbi:MAG: hypothetical protein B6229_10710 [Spirochaetaceae bacterium 4572_7]|nr:MAG: hypothetical protein B6229_10710 [Spirochaetaceae bacterium 4572_7]
MSKVLTKVLDSNDPYEPTESPFGKCRIILFGSSFLGESAIKFFNFLSKDIDVHHFILTPSKIYAGEEEVKPLSILNNFSGLINGFTAISRENDFQKTRESFFTEIKGNTLLSSIQRGIRDNSFTDDKNPELQSFSFTDNSLKICRVTGGWREIEVLKDKILALLDGDPTLKLTDGS